MMSAACLSRKPSFSDQPCICWDQTAESPFRSNIMYPESLLVWQELLVSLVMRDLNSSTRTRTKTVSDCVAKFLLYGPWGAQSYSTIHKCPARHKLYTDDPTTSGRERESFVPFWWVKLRLKSTCTATTLNTSLPFSNYYDASAASDSDHHYSRHSDPDPSYPLTEEKKPWHPN